MEWGASEDVSRDGMESHQRYLQEGRSGNGLGDVTGRRSGPDMSPGDNMETVQGYLRARDISEQD